MIAHPPADPGEPPNFELTGNLGNILKAGGFAPKSSEEQAVNAHLSGMINRSAKRGQRARPSPRRHGRGEPAQQTPAVHQLGEVRSRQGAGEAGAGKDEGAGPLHGASSLDAATKDCCR